MVAYRHCALFGLGLLVIASLGCTDRYLRKNSVRHVRTLTDLMYSQVLDNVAMFTCEPNTLPHFAIVGDGTTQVTDQAGANPGMNWNPTTLTGATLGLSGSHNVMENWKLQPVMSAGRLRRMRTAFQYLMQPRVFGVEQALDGDRVRIIIADDAFNPFLSEMISLQLLPDPSSFLRDGKRLTKAEVKAFGIGFTHDDSVIAVQDAEAYLAELLFTLEKNFPTGWYCCGKRTQSMFRCAHVGHYQKQWVWVESGCEDALARFTTTLLAIASLDPPAAPSTPIVSISKKFYENGAIYELKWDEKKRDLKLCDPITPQICPVKAAADAQSDMRDLSNFEAIGFDQRNSLKNLSSRPIVTVEDVKRAQSSLRALTDLPEELEAKRRKALDRLNVVERALDPADSPAPATPDAFDRPGSSPFSRSGGGAEFIPDLRP